MNRGLSKIFVLIFLLLGLCCCSANSYNFDDHRKAAQATVDWLRQEHGVINSSYADYYFGELTSHFKRTIHHTPELRNKTLNNSNSWAIVILDSNEPNAFSVGTGIIVVTKGLICALNDEAELASVVAHEMSHELLGHTRAAFETLSDNSNPVTFHYDNSQEIAADNLGFDMLIAGGFNPRAALEAFLIAYRPELKGVSDNIGSWRSIRASNLYKKVHSTSFIDKPAKSRAFNKLKALCSIH